MIIVGIDPGASGGIAFRNTKADEAWAIKMPETEADLVNELRMVLLGNEMVAYIEQVSAMPKQGVSSTFKFGQSYGLLRGVLAGLGIRRNFVVPRKWQGALCCLSKGNKNVTKSRAQEMFPDVKVTHAIADALLIAEYGRRAELGLLK